MVAVNMRWRRHSVKRSRHKKGGPAKLTPLIAYPMLDSWVSICARNAIRISADMLDLPM